MIKFTPFESRLVPIPFDNIDTDQIIPARFLKTTSKDGLGDQLFCDWRYDADGCTARSSRGAVSKPKPDRESGSCFAKADARRWPHGRISGRRVFQALS